MKEESLGYFETPKSFQRFIDELDIYNGWKITKGLMNTRGELIRNKPYSNQLRKMFSVKKAFRREVSISEIVSWLDSFVMINRTLNILKTELSKEEYDKIEIYFEYIIRMSKKMRIDFIIKYNQKLLLVELRMVNDFGKIRGTWHKKKSELLIYKELMYNYINHDIRILTYALITLYEFDGKQKNQKHLKFNNDQARYLAEYINKFMINCGKKTQL